MSDPLGRDIITAMSDLPRPPGVLPPRDLNVPWYAWVVFPLVLAALLAVLSLIFGKLLPLF